MWPKISQEWTPWLGDKDKEVRREKEEDREPRRSVRERERARRGIWKARKKKPDEKAKGYSSGGKLMMTDSQECSMEAELWGHADSAH